MFCRSLFVLLATALSVLFLFTGSDYAFGIFKLSLYMGYVHFYFVPVLCQW